LVSSGFCFKGDHPIAAVKLQQTPRGKPKAEPKNRR